MPIRAQASALILSIATLLAGPAPASEEITLREDLTAVIMLLGLACGQVLNAEQQAESDYLATCANGDRYRVFVNPEGRVVALLQTK